MIKRVGIFTAVAVGVLLMGGPLTSAAVGADAAPEVISAEAPGGLLDAAMFYLVAAVAVMSALGVCFTKNIVRMTVWLFGALGSAALLYFLLAANFIAAIQLIVPQSTKQRHPNNAAQTTTAPAISSFGVANFTQGDLLVSMTPNTSNMSVPPA